MSPLDTIWMPHGDDLSGPGKSAWIAAAIRNAVRAGELPRGTRLPAVRDLAWQMGVTPGTVARAYQMAAREGLIESHVGRGSFVRTPSEPPVLQPMLTGRVAAGDDGGGPVDLRLLQPPEVGQVAAIRAALHRVADRLGPELLDYPALDRDRPCRAAFLDWLADRDLGGVDVDDTALCMGGQHGMQTVLQLVLRGPRPVLLTEALGYPGLRHAGALAGGEAVPVPLDGRGMIPAALAAAARDTGAQVVCLTPNAQNPTATRMDGERRTQIVAVARRHDMQIVEDDCIDTASPRDCALPSLRALAPERTWYVTSLSKTLSAALRAGLIVAPDGKGAAARLAVQHSCFGVPLPVTAVVQDLLATGALARLSAQVHAICAERVALAVRELDGCDISWHPETPFLFMRLPPGWRGSTFARQAAAEGVLIRSADEFAPLHGAQGRDGPAVPNAVRIALAGQISPARLAGAMAVLRRLHDSPGRDLVV